MEKTVENFSIELLFLQTLILVLALTIVYFLVKLYKKTLKYLEKK